MLIFIKITDTMTMLEINIVEDESLIMNVLREFEHRYLLTLPIKIHFIFW